MTDLKKKKDGRGEHQPSRKRLEKRDFSEGIARERGHLEPVGSWEPRDYRDCGSGEWSTVPVTERASG